MMIGHHIHGHGPVKLLAFHGWFSDWRTFEPVLPALDPNIFTIAFMDYRGYGASKSIEGPFDIPAIAQDAAALATHLGWKRFAVLGHSMGGKAALRLAVDLGDKVSRIIAVTPVWASAAPFDSQTLAFFRSAAKDLQARAAIITQSTGGKLPATWTRWMAKNSAEVSSAEAFAAYFESWAMTDFAEAASRLTQETLIIAGGNDGGIPIEVINATWLANLRNARAEILADCGHYPMLERPLALAASIERFLAPTQHN